MLAGSNVVGAGQDVQLCALLVKLNNIVLYLFLQRTLLAALQLAIHSQVLDVCRLVKLVAFLSYLLITERI